jgi:putative ABC transport system permease protein
MLEIRPILSALLRNRTGAILIALQIAFTLAVLLNAAFVVSQRVASITRPTGMDVANIVTAQAWAVGEDTDIENMIALDLDALRAIPGVIAATASNQVPLSGGGWGDTLNSAPEGAENRVSVNSARYQIDETGLDVLGVTLQEGRAFRAEEVRWRAPNSSVQPPSFIVTRATADALFPEGDALGRTVYDGLDRPSTIVGIIETMHGAWVHWDKLGNVTLSPERPSGPLVRYLVRVEAGLADRLTGEVEKALIERDSTGRVIRRVVPMLEYKQESYSGDRAMAVLLVIVVCMLTLVTVFGVVGLASFSVSQRTRQIGTRRALGGRRAHIIRYFMVENWLITTAGVIVGSVLGVAFNIWLADQSAIARLHPLYVPIGIVALWAIGLLSVLGPARRAARIQPAIATRTV